MQVKNNRKYSFFAVLSVLFFAVSCDEKQVFDQYKKLGGSWSKNDTVRFEFQHLDTVNPYHLFLNIRNNSNYPFNNLFVIVALKNPNGEVKTDTLEYLMANPDGRLMGEGFSDIKESKLWYQENFVFKKAGKYTVDIQHALRETGNTNGMKRVEGVTEVGFRIEKTK